MKVLVVGSGGREHALGWKLSQSPGLERLYCAPGNAGTAQIGECVPISADDIEGLCRFARDHRIDLTIVGPEAPLVAGIVDRFRDDGLAIVGPTKAAAELEGSKAFAKDFMARHGIPTAAYAIYDRADEAERTLASGRFQFPLVLKADGLAAGKGVFICSDQAEATQALALIMRDRAFGAAGDRLVIEEYLTGEEASFMVFSDSEHALPMVPSQDHKAIFEGDKGPNTGGMGAYSVDGILSEDEKTRILDEIIHPTIQGMAQEGRPYRGVLYAGLMLTAGGPRVLEFNVRFGDPETQVVLPRMETDLLEVLWAAAQSSLRQIAIQWKGNATVCVVLAANGYPGPYEKGKEISGLEMAGEDSHTIVFHAGTASRNDKIVSNGGRVLGVTARSTSLEEAIIRAYEAVNKIHFEGMYYRRDIAAKGLKKMT